MDFDFDDLLASQVPADNGNKKSPRQPDTKQAKRGGGDNDMDGDFFNFEKTTFKGSADLDFDNLDNEPPARKKKVVVAEDDDLRSLRPEPAPLNCLCECGHFPPHLGNESTKARDCRGLDFLDLQRFSICTMDDDWCTPKLATEDKSGGKAPDKQNAQDVPAEDVAQKSSDCFSGSPKKASQSFEGREESSEISGFGGANSECPFNEDTASLRKHGGSTEGAQESHGDAVHEEVHGKCSAMQIDENPSCTVQGDAEDFIQQEKDRSNGTVTADRSVHSFPSSPQAAHNHEIAAGDKLSETEKNQSEVHHLCMEIYTPGSGVATTPLTNFAKSDQEPSCRDTPSDVEMVQSTGNGEGHDKIRSDHQEKTEVEAALLTDALEPAMMVLEKAQYQDQQRSRGHQKPEEGGEIRLDRLSDSRPVQLLTTDVWTPESCTPMRVSEPRVEDLTLDEKIGQINTQIDQVAVTATASRPSGVPPTLQHEDRVLKDQVTDLRSIRPGSNSFDLNGKAVGDVFKVVANTQEKEICSQRLDTPGEKTVSPEPPTNQLPHLDNKRGQETLAGSTMNLQNDVGNPKQSHGTSVQMTTNKQPLVPLTPLRRTLRRDGQLQRLGLKTSPVCGLIHEKGHKILQNVSPRTNQNPQCIMRDENREAPESVRSEAQASTVEKDVAATPRAGSQCTDARVITLDSNIPETPRKSVAAALKNQNGSIDHGNAVTVLESATKKQITLGRLLATPARHVLKPLSLSGNPGVMKVCAVDQVGGNERVGQKSLRTLELTKLTRGTKDAAFQDAFKQKLSLQPRSSKQAFQPAVPATPRASGQHSLEKRVYRDATDTERRVELNSRQQGATHMDVESGPPFGHDLQKMFDRLKQKHEEAKDLLVRALVTNNILRMLDNPMNEERIQSIRRSIEDKLPAAMEE